MQLRNWVVLAAVSVAPACYHATVETGATPSTVTIEKEWAAGWIYGLVAPSTVATREKCKTGVAKVETQLSLPNMLVSWITFGIFTPMSIKVTCAAQGTASLDGNMLPVVNASEDSPAARRVALEDAARLSLQMNRPVLIQE